jgi:tetratricopeptide (TPR) repeat protein/mono/diheme cytochrome c family protein
MAQRGLYLAAVVVAFSAAPEAPQAAQDEVTYAETVAPILLEHCVQCHRPGGLGPFSLLDYESARDRAALIASVTRRGEMPPWKPSAPTGVFQGERRLTSAQIESIARWAAAGAPEGKAPVRPIPLNTADGGWQLGTPDLIVRLPEPYVVPAGTSDLYRKFVLPVPLDEPRWIRALEIRPGPGGAIHHARVMIDSIGRARDLDAADPLPGYDGFMADSGEFPRGHVLGWAPGKSATARPDSLSWPLTPGSDLVLQLHLLPRPAPASVAPEVGLYFAAAPATLQPVAVILNALTIDIPPGDAAHVVVDRYQLPVAVDVLAISPHAHYLAREIHATAILPDRTERTLLRIDDWDYNWQDEYRYVEPVRLPAGTRIEMRYVYDNSAANPRNPHHPPQPVRFGPKATDEMAQLLLQVLTVNPDDRLVLTRHLRLKSVRDEMLGYQARVRREPTDHVARTGLATRYLEVGEVDGAIRELRESIRLAPEYPDAHFNLAGALHAQGAVKEAIAAYRRAIELDPDYAEAHNNLGVLLETVGDRVSAVDHYRRAVQIQPHQSDAHLNLGNALVAGGHPEEAIEHYRRALAGHPEDAETHFRLGRVLTQIRRRAEAVIEYRQALGVRPNLASALLDLAWLLATAPEPTLRDPNEAVALAQRAMPGTDHPIVLDTLAAAYAAEGRFDEAVETVRRALDRARAIPELRSRTAAIEHRLRLYLARQPYRMPE